MGSTASLESGSLFALLLPAISEKAHVTDCEILADRRDSCPVPSCCVSAVVFEAAFAVKTTL